MSQRNYYRDAVDVAVREVGKPLADLTISEAEDLYLRVLDILCAWGVLMGLEHLFQQSERCEDLGVGR